jgi:hypothetical protein
LNHKPVNGIAGHRPTDLAAEFLYGRHRSTSLLHVPRLP